MVHEDCEKKRVDLSVSKSADDLVKVIVAAEANPAESLVPRFAHAMEFSIMKWACMGTSRMLTSLSGWFRSMAREAEKLHATLLAATFLLQLLHPQGALDPSSTRTAVQLKR